MSSGPDRVAFAATRDNLRERAQELAPVFARNGIRLRADRVSDAARTIAAALDDPRPLNTDPRKARDVHRTKRELTHALDVLERWLVTAA